ncbi:MAG: hypothetical protein U1G07_04810 [Verrucomicrobiota bacterium]
MCSASKPKAIYFSGRTCHSGRDEGAVLLEVVLALVLFVGAAAVLTSGLNSSIEGLERLRRQTHAADLAVSVLSELQMGIKTATLAGPQPFEKPLDNWTWEVIAGPSLAEGTDSGPYRRVEVVIRNDETGLVHRLTQVVRLDEAAGVTESSSSGQRSF